MSTPGPYAVQYDPRALKELSKRDRSTARHIVSAVDALGADPRPRGMRPLVGYPDLWRIRVGDYWVIYPIRDAELLGARPAGRPPRECQPQPATGARSSCAPPSSRTRASAGIASTTGALATVCWRASPCSAGRLVERMAHPLGTGGPSRLGGGTHCLVKLMGNADLRQGDFPASDNDGRPRPRTWRTASSTTASSRSSVTLPSSMPRSPEPIHLVS